MMNTNSIETYNVGNFYFPDSVNELPNECQKYFKSSIDAKLEGIPCQYGMSTCVKSFTIQKIVKIKIKEL
jgi:hypothetical protein